MSFAASAVIIAYGYLRLKLFDLVPVALDILIERIPDAMFVLDPAGHIIDANPAAERLVATFKGHLVGRHLCNVLPGNLADRELCTGIPSAAMQDVVFDSHIGADSLTYEPTVTELSEVTSRNGSNGRLVILRDVTEQRAASESLMRLGRITTLNAITTGVVEMHDVQSIMETATSRLADLLSDDHVVGLILEPTSGDFTVVTTSGEHSLEPIPVGSKAFDSQILTPGSDEGVHNLSETGGHLDDFTYLFAAAGLYSVIGHNLAANGETYGAIIVARHEHASLGSAEVELITAVGAAVAQAIYGARLVDELRVMTVELVETQQRAMVQQVMQRHSGTISILPGKEKGTIVRLVFPLATSITVSKPKIPEERTDSPKLKIMVVDDEPMLRMVVQEMLTSEGRAVEVAPGGPEASMSDTTTMLLGEPFDVVVSDIEMPALNGRMLANFIEIESPETEVILMTGWADSRIDVDTISTRVVGVLSKPPRLADISALMAVVARNIAPVLPNDS
jgi:CheY-like chemotaxis protein/PAS domain-containing protein